MPIFRYLNILIVRYLIVRYLIGELERWKTAQSLKVMRE